MLPDFDDKERGPQEVVYDEQINMDHALVDDIMSAWRLDAVAAARIYRPAAVRRAIYVDGEDAEEQFELLLDQLHDPSSLTVGPRVTGRGEIMKLELFGHTVIWGVVRAVGRPYPGGGVPDDGLIVETVTGGRIVARWVAKASVYGLRTATNAEANRGLRTFVGGNPERRALEAAIAVDLYAGEETPDDPLEGLSPTLVAAARALYDSAHTACREGTLPGRWADDLWGAWVELALPVSKADYKWPRPNGALRPPFCEMELHKALRALVDEMEAERKAQQPHNGWKVMD